jgi:two-component system, OmpR family, sensor kinase
MPPEGEDAVRSDRLTRQELTWLLTQEARSAAEKLRQGVAVLSTAKVRALASPPPSSIEPELDALDDAMKTLASLYAGGPARGRRGRVDLAALVWEVAPAARVSIEPGSGTEVFGDEAELRRMLQVLLGSTASTSGGLDPGALEVSIRRDGGEVSVAVVLGPDSSAHAGTERAWLARMATRYGGRLLLDGATESIRLPADVAEDQQEVESLRRELLAAQRHGEACARELVTAFSSHPPQTPATLSVLTAVASSLASQLSPVFAALERDAAARDNAGTMAEQIALGAEVVSDLARLGRCANRDTVHPVDVGGLVKMVVGDLLSRCKGRGVALTVSVVPASEIDVHGSHLALLVRTLVGDAILATPRGGSVSVTLRNVHHEALALPCPVITIDDGGPPIEPDGYVGIVEMRIDPSSVGRPSTIALVTAHAIAQQIGAIVSPVQSARGRIEVSLAPCCPGHPG